LGFAALEAGLDLILSLGVPQIFEHVTAYLDALEPQLLARGFKSLRGKDESARSGILSLVPPAGHDAASLRAKLLARGIVCGTPDGLLRFSPHWPNALSEVALITAELDALLAQR
ncbi:MAG TPA: aminotransferase class V-fold PLP-dependent enzyme, partial [Polyangiaceae bacterium]|nr:aminotransferase class V-fold PLP-dependent enzyme [Polyangiaceae bacterium]